MLRNPTPITSSLSNPLIPTSDPPTPNLLTPVELYDWNELELDFGNLRDVWDVWDLWDLGIWDVCDLAQALQFLLQTHQLLLLL